MSAAASAAASARGPGRAPLSAVAGLSLALNLMGLTWGLPARWHPDEKADVVAAMARSGSLAPDSFINPSLPLYALLPAIGLQQRAETAGLSGVFVDPLLAGRVLSALAGAGAVFLLGLASSRTHPRLGLLPPLLLAVAPGAVNLCHFATPEAWLLLGVTATILGALRHAEGRAPAWALGLAVGLSASVKYTAAALLVPAVAAVWLAPSSTDRTTAAGARDRALLLAAGLMACAIGLALLMEPGVALAAQLHLKDARLLLPESAQRFVHGVGRAALGAGAALVGLALVSQFFRTRPWAARLARSQIVAVGLAAAAGFLIGTPFAVLRPVSFLGDLAFNDQTRFEYKGLVGASTSYLSYLGLLADAFTAPALAAVLVGAVVAGARAWRGDRAAFLVLLAFGAPYLLVASSGHQALRFLAAALPAGAWLAALGLAALPGPSAGGFAAVVVARAFVGAVLVVRLFFVDSRVLAARWMEAHVPPGAVVDVIANHTGYAPPVPPGRTLRIVPTLSREMAPVERFREAAARYPAEASPWLILTASFYQRFLEHPDQQPERAAFFRDLLEGRSGFAVAARFHQEGWKRPGADEFLDPEIVILRKTSG